MTRGPVVVGVDVGGSGLRLQATYAGVPATVHTAPGVRIGVNGIDVAAAVADARRILDAELRVGAGPMVPNAEVVPDVVVWSMRGLLFLADRADVLRTVREGLGAGQTVVVSDALANLVGAVGGLLPGAVVAAGSGAVAFGTDFVSHWTRVDGWGHVLGDVGSGAWIGLEGLRAALRAHDGLRGGSQVLLDEAERRLGGPPTWPRQLMAAADAPSRLAAFAPVVTGVADRDPVAADICRRAGAGLAESLRAAAKGLDHPVLTGSGGVLEAPAVGAALEQSLAESGARLTPAMGNALDGALVLGAHVAGRGHLPEHPAYLLVG
jgi:N-acetylglucosamine kinase-like BadF-type ATPase